MNATKIILWSILAAAIMFVIPQVFILLALGLSPTIVAFIVDRSKQKYATFCVGGMNIAGVIPSLMDLWNGNNNVSAAMEILTNPFDVIIMFAGAAFGWMLYLAIPPIVSGLFTVTAHHRIAQLRVEQKRLIKEWGEGIAMGPQAIEAREAAYRQNEVEGEQETVPNEEAEEELIDHPSNPNGSPEPQSPATT